MCGGPHRVARWNKGDRGLGRNRCTPRVTAKTGIVGPPTLRLHPRVSACPSRARGLLSAQWKPGYHGPACQGPRHSSEDFAKDQALQAWRGSPSLVSLAEDCSLGEGPFLERASSQKARRGLQPRGVPSPRSQLCLRDRAHMGSASSAESRARSVTETELASWGRNPARLEASPSLLA